MGEWISVEDRMPEIVEQNILGDITLSKYVITAIKTKDGGSYVSFNRFVDDEKGSIKEWMEPMIKTEGVVTHWMPLPEPPKEGV